MDANRAAAVIRLVAGFFFFTGLLLASGAFAPIDSLSVLVHDALDWPLDGRTGPYTKEARWFAAIGGGLLSGMSTLFFLVIAPLVAEGDPAVRRRIVAAMIVWFVIDSAGSIAAGAPGNAAFNVVFLTMLVGPLLAVREGGGA